VQAHPHKEDQVPDLQLQMNKRGQTRCAALTCLAYVMVRYARAVVNYADEKVAERYGLLPYTVALLIVIEPPFPMVIIIGARGAAPVTIVSNALWIEPECVLAAS
jgi:hypothetical protein